MVQPKVQVLSTTVPPRIRRSNKTIRNEMKLFVILTVIASSVLVFSAPASDSEQTAETDYQQTVRVKGQLLCGWRPTFANETDVVLVNSSKHVF